MQTEVNTETSLEKVWSNPGRLNSAELAAGGAAQDVSDASLIGHRSASQRRRDCKHMYRHGLQRNPVIVPVLALDGEPLMPTSASRARRWVKQEKATPFWSGGVWCVRLRFEPSARNKQEVCTQPMTKATYKRVFGPALPNTGPVNIGLDWLPNPRNGRVVFQVQVSRHGQMSATDFEIYLSELSSDDLEKLSDFLAARHAGLKDGYTTTRGIVWLLDRSITQQQPLLSKSNRDGQVRELLLSAQ